MLIGVCFYMAAKWCGIVCAVHEAPELSNHACKFLMFPQAMKELGDPLLRADVLMAFLGLPQRRTKDEGQRWWRPAAVVNVELEARLQSLIRGVLAV